MPRIDLNSRESAAAMRALFGVEQYVQQSGLGHTILHLVKLRASIMNHCAYCVDMHTKDARLAGETEQRLYAVSVWRETPFFTPRERAALAWTETVTDVMGTGVPDEAFEAVSKEFTPQEVLNLTMAIIAINSWNRAAVSFRNEPGSYQPGQHAQAPQHAAPAAK